MSGLVGGTRAEMVPHMAYFTQRGLDSLCGPGNLFPATAGFSIISSWHALHLGEHIFFINQRNVWAFEIEMDFSLLYILIIDKWSLGDKAEVWHD